MKLIKRLRYALMCEVALMLVVLGLFKREGAFFLMAVFLFVLQAAAALYIMFWVLGPLKSFEDTLDYLIYEEGTEEKFHSVMAQTPYMEQVEELVEKYASKRTRKNSAQVFDKQAELTALQSQINPHFLYNTLESIRGQALIDDNAEIARMVEALAAFFRYSISRTGNLVTLRDELANINNYMLIQRYRFNNRFSLEIIIDEEDEAAYDFLIPRLIIQPVVENAIFHGLEERMEGGKVTIEVIVTEENLILTISDNGRGIDGKELKELNNRIRSFEISSEDTNKGKTRNTGIALPNVHKRIQLLFGEEYGVNIYSTLGQGTDVEITIPANYERSGDWDNEERNLADE